jgi:catechol 2,3-dioxygenase-like lactoylglutathione lyase family enzyme
MKNAQLRVARPTDNLKQVADMYREGLGFETLATFEDHDGFDGVILGVPGAQYHLEFTQHRGQMVGKAPTEDHLLVFYLPDSQEWSDACERMRRAGFRQVTSFNPYWDRRGCTFEDVDGYRVVLQRASWGE